MSEITLEAEWCLMQSGKVTFDMHREGWREICQANCNLHTCKTLRVHLWDFKKTYVALILTNNIPSQGREIWIFLIDEKACIMVNTGNSSS